jgi:hypothetical protein
VLVLPFVLQFMTFRQNAGFAFVPDMCAFAIAALDQPVAPPVVVRLLMIMIVSIFVPVPTACLDLLACQRLILYASAPRI